MNKHVRYLLLGRGLLEVHEASAVVRDALPQLHLHVAKRRAELSLEIFAQLKAVGLVAQQRARLLVQLSRAADELGHLRTQVGLGRQGEHTSELIVRRTNVPTM